MQERETLEVRLRNIFAVVPHCRSISLLFLSVILTLYLMENDTKS